MRLLRLEDDGELSLPEYFGKDIPRYAILSHTWGADRDEVTYKDIVKDRGKHKAGYNKIRFCGKQAANDGLRHFWIDTCCIDKSSSAELSEAINSMFRWYYDAAKCYVYLSDVSVGDSPRNGPSWQGQWKLAFQRSRWFTRGWTLQELIAPASVEFFSAEGERLGNMVSLMGEIHEITKINIRALQGIPLSQFSVDERMSWAERRETKREEDAAYSMLGLFDVHMPLIYGEGREKALIRLQREIKEANTNYPETSRPEKPLIPHQKKGKEKNTKRSGKFAFDDGWESAPDDASDSSSVSSGLGFGDYNWGKSQEPVASNTSNASKWSWLWGGKDKKKPTSNNLSQAQSQPSHNAPAVPPVYSEGSAQPPYFVHFQSGLPFHANSSPVQTPRRGDIAFDERPTGVGEATTAAAMAMDHPFNSYRNAQFGLAEEHAGENGDRWRGRRLREADVRDEMKREPRQRERQEQPYSSLNESSREQVQKPEQQRASGSASSDIPSLEFLLQKLESEQQDNRVAEFARVAAIVAASTAISSQPNIGKTEEPAIKHVEPSRVAQDYTDEDIFDPRLFKKRNSQPSFRDVFQDLETRYNEAPVSQADFFAPKEILEDRTPSPKIDPNEGATDIHIYQAHDDFDTMPQKAPPYHPPYSVLATYSSVPTINLIEPTPPGSGANSIKGTSPPMSPVTHPEESNKDQPKQHENTRNAPVHWGDDQFHHYEVVAPD